MDHLDPRDAVLRYMLAPTRAGERRKTFLPVISLVQQHGRAAANAATPASLPQGFALGTPHDEPRVYKSNASNTSLLHWLCLHGKAQYVALLVARGADIHRVDVNGRTALMTACAAGCAEAVRVLLASGARADCTCDKGYTALLLAVLKRSYEVVELLLSWGAETLGAHARVEFVNARLSTGYTALALAARAGHMPMAKLLYGHGAHQSVTYDGESTVELAAKYGHSDLKDWLVLMAVQDVTARYESRHAQLHHREVLPGPVNEYGEVEPPVAL